MSEVSLPATAKKRGICFYTLPEDLKPEQVDPLIRKAVFRINDSGWCWTAESCQGHPDARKSQAWAHNVRPMLRLVTEKAYYGHMLALLMESACWDNDGFNASHVFDVCPSTENWGRYYTQKEDPGFRSVLVYVQGATAWDRNLGIACYDRFAELVNTRKPV